MNAFGQEFYPLESIRALQAAFAANVTDRDTLVEVIADELTQESAETRMRIAAKFVQRYIRTRGNKVSPAPAKQPFLRLLVKTSHLPTRIELLFWQLSRVDTIVGAIARDLFYPVFIEGRPPQGYGEHEFGALNGSRLFMTEPLLTREFILGHAARQWHFHNTATIDRSLRVLQGAGLIERYPMLELPGHPAAYVLKPHDVNLMTFVWALHDEFMPHVPESGLDLSTELLPLADFARTLLLSREQIAAHIEMACRQSLISMTDVSGTPSIRLAFDPQGSHAAESINNNGQA